MANDALLSQGNADPRIGRGSSQRGLSQTNTECNAYLVVQASQDARVAAFRQSQKRPNRRQRRLALVALSRISSRCFAQRQSMHYDSCQLWYSGQYAKCHDSASETIGTQDPHVNVGCWGRKVSDKGTPIDVAAVTYLTTKPN